MNRNGCEPAGRGPAGRSITGGGIPEARRAGRGEAIACLLGVLAGVLYNSWPLGFVLDRPALGGTYLSVLEMPGRPYADLFVGCDLAAGAMAVVAGVLLLRHPAVAAGLVMFGIGNVLEASIPIETSCASSVAACGGAAGQVLEPHSLASVLSVAGLVLALWSLRNHSRWMQAVVLSVAVTALFLLVSVLADRWVTVSQISFLVACGVALGAVPLAPLLSRSGSPRRRSAAPPRSA
jgi:hypothetical protein